MKKQLICPLLLLCFMGFSAIAIAETTPATALEVAVPVDIVGASYQVATDEINTAETASILATVMFDNSGTTPAGTARQTNTRTETIVTQVATASGVATPAEIVAGFSLASS